MMTIRAPHYHADAVGHFGEGVLRPPVPGEENIKGNAARPETYEPEGRASSDHIHPSWAESLNTLLDDQDGIALFRDFLMQQGCTDVIDFWLACSGFRLAFFAPLSLSSASMEMLDKRRLKLAKAIYRKYIISGGIVEKKIKTVTKSHIRERVRHTQLDSTLFEQAKQEVQEAMEVEAYPIFLKSNIFLTYTREICTEPENHNCHKQETGSDNKELINSEKEPNSKDEVNSLTLETGNDKQELTSPKQNPKGDTKEQKPEMQRFPPNLAEKREWAGSEIGSANHKRPERWEVGYKLKHTHKTSLHKPDHTELHKFAADLISRLERLQSERENWRGVEEHPHPICTRQEDDDGEVSTVSSLGSAHLLPVHHGASHSMFQRCVIHADNSGIILNKDDQSVIQTDSWSSPITHTHTCPKNSDTWHNGDITGTNQCKALAYRTKCACETMTVAYYFCGEPIPYRTTVKGRVVTLGHFRELLTRKEAYRFFFKKASDDFDIGVVYEEVRGDDTVLPVFEGRIIGKVEKIY